MSLEIAWKQNILVTDFHLLKSLLVVFGFGSQAFVCGFSRQNICSVVQFSKFDNFLWLCWFLGKNLSNCISPVWKLHNPYCHKCTEEQFTSFLYGEFTNYRRFKELNGSKGGNLGPKITFINIYLFFYVFLPTEIFLSKLLRYLVVSSNHLEIWFLVFTIFWSDWFSAF